MAAVALVIGPAIVAPGAASSASAVERTRTPQTALATSASGIEHPRFASIAASATTVTEADPFTVIDVRLDGPTVGDQRIAIYDDTGALVGSCQGYECVADARPAKGTSRRYTAYLVTGAPPQTGVPSFILANSQTVTVTNAGWAPQVAITGFTASAASVTEADPYTYVDVTLDGTLPANGTLSVWDSTGVDEDPVGWLTLP